MIYLAWELILSTIKSSINCHSERAKLVKNLYGDLNNFGLGDASAPFSLRLSMTN